MWSCKTTTPDFLHMERGEKGDNFKMNKAEIYGNYTNYKSHMQYMFRWLFDSVDTYD